MEAFIVRLLVTVRHHVNEADAELIVRASPYLEEAEIRAVGARAPLSGNLDEVLFLDVALE